MRYGSLFTQTLGKYLSTLMVFLLLCSPALSQKSNEPLAIINAPNALGLPRHFRSMALIPYLKTSSGVSLAGVEKLRLSGSAQYSKDQFEIMLQHLPSPVFIIDLRQESHGFIDDGLPISWYTQHDWANLGLSYDEIHADEHRRLKDITERETILYQMFHVTKKIKEAIPWTAIRAKTAVSEAQLLSRYNVNYIRLPVPDHMRPDDQTVDRFLKIMKSLPPDAWVHFHCAAGNGRTTTFMVLYGIIKNVRDINWRSIVHRQAVWGPLDLAQIPPKTSWKYSYFIERLKFIENFYQYILQDKGDFSPTWSEWIKTQGKS